jgi:mono/diheme cytochrome c family protein
MRFAVSVFVLVSVLATALVAAPEPALTYKDVKSIFEKRCLSCHGAEYPGGSFRVDSYEAIMKGGQHGKAVVVGKSAESRIMKMMKGTIQPRMPMDGAPIPRPELEKISKWITQGAKK